MQRLQRWSRVIAKLVNPDPPATMTADEYREWFQRRGIDRELGAYTQSWPRGGGGTGRPNRHSREISQRERAALAAIDADPVRLRHAAAGDSIQIVDPSPHD